MENDKTYIEDVHRSIYDIKNEVKYSYKTNSGLTKEIIEQISDEKNDPEWMREFRLKSLDIYNSMPMPSWGPDLKGLNMENIVTYIRPDTDMKHDWNDVPDDIKRLSIYLVFQRQNINHWQVWEHSMIQRLFIIM